MDKGEHGREEETEKMRAKRQPLSKFSVLRLNVRQGHREEYKTKPLPLSSPGPVGKTNEGSSSWLRAASELRR